MFVWMAWTAAAAPGDPGWAERTAAKMTTSIESDSAVRLVSKGKGKKRRLMFTPTPGSTSRSMTTTSFEKSGVVVLPNGEERPLPGETSPVTSVGKLTTIGQPDSGGAIPIRVLHESYDVIGTGGAGDAMRKSFEQLEGTEYVLWWKDGGVHRSEAGETQDAAVEEMLLATVRNSADGFSQFPVEPIGKTGVYTVKSDLDLMGVDIAVLQTTTVESIKGRRVTLSFDITMELEGGDFKLPGAPEGSTASISKFEGKGSGSTWVDLDTLESEGSTTSIFEFEMSVQFPDQPKLDILSTTKQVHETALR